MPSLSQFVHQNPRFGSRRRAPPPLVAGRRRRLPTRRRSAIACVLHRRIEIQCTGFNLAVRAARVSPQPLDLDPTGLDRATRGQLGQPGLIPAILQKSPCVFRYSQKYPSTLEVSLQFNPFSLF
jgi:hypothetical protein